MKKTIKIGNGSGFWGDRPGAGVRLLEQAGDLDFLTFDYLAEISMGILAIQKGKDPKLGYAPDFVDVVRGLESLWKEGSECRIVTNAGGLNPIACAEACAELTTKKIAVVLGDDLLDEMGEGALAANVYLGAKSIADALTQGAEIVITGRVADPSLVVGPCVAIFGWGWDQYDPLAGATVAGHLIECGAQVTGGISTDWLEIDDPATIPFPIVEVDGDGMCVVTKAAHTGGVVSVDTVKEQLLYEIGDPTNYLSPDVTVNFTQLMVESVGENRVAVKGAKGSAPPETAKVGVIEQKGFRAEGMLALFGQDVVAKGRRCGEVILEHVREKGYQFDESIVECIGAGDVVPGLFAVPEQLRECMLRVAVADRSEDAVRCFTKEIAAMVTAGPPGVTGYTTGRPKVRSYMQFRSETTPLSEVTSSFQFVEKRGIC